MSTLLYRSIEQANLSMKFRSSSGSPVADFWFLDVGQGDCTVVVDHESRQAVLIDCPSGCTSELYEMMSERRLRVHSAIVTHWDLDHYGGIARISRAIRPSHVYYNHDTLFTDDNQGRFIRTTLQAFLDLAPLGTELHSLRYSDELQVGSVTIRFLAPTQEEVTRAYLTRRRNVASAVVAVEAGPIRVLIGGDAVASTWERLLGSTENLSADILRWPHHGAELHDDRSGIAERVIATVQPQRIIISAGFGNRYQHPAMKVVMSAAQQGIYVACTQVTAQCFGHHTREEQASAAAQTALSAVTHRSCAGTIHVAVTASQMIADPSITTHSSTVDQWPKPLCRSGPEKDEPTLT